MADFSKMRIFTSVIDIIQKVEYEVLEKFVSNSLSLVLEGEINLYCC
jgi:hypothetical protein